MGWLTENCDTTVDWENLPEIESEHKIQNRFPLSLWVPHCAAMSFIELSLEVQQLVKNIAKGTENPQDKERLAKLILKIQAVTSKKVFGHMEAVADELISESVYSIKLREGLDIRKPAGFVRLEKEVAETIHRTENESLAETISKLFDAPEHELEEGLTEQFEQNKRNYLQSLAWARQLMKKIKWGKIDSPPAIVSCSYHIGILSVAHHWSRVLLESVNRYLTPVVVNYTLQCSYIEEDFFTEETGLTLAGITRLLDEVPARNLMMKLPEGWGCDNIQSLLEGEFLRAVGRRKLSGFSCPSDDKFVASEHSLFEDRPDILTMFQNLGGRQGIYGDFVPIYQEGLGSKWKNTREFYDDMKQQGSEMLIKFEKELYRPNRRSQNRNAAIDTEKKEEEKKRRNSFADGLTKYIRNHPDTTPG